MIADSDASCYELPGEPVTKNWWWENGIRRIWLYDVHIQLTLEMYNREQNTQQWCNHGDCVIHFNIQRQEVVLALHTPLVSERRCKGSSINNH